jgi:transcription antitermination protein NusB
MSAKLKARSAARLSAVQALYQMDVGGADLGDILAVFDSGSLKVPGEEELPPADGKFFHDVVTGVVREQRTLDPLVDGALNTGWPLARVEAVLRAVLRAGAYELLHKAEIPARVVVSEYVNVAGAFLDGEETGMVNAVLEQIARRARGAEFQETASG